MEYRREKLLVVLIVLILGLGLLISCDPRQSSEKTPCEEIRIICKWRIVETVCGRDWILVANRVDFTQCYSGNREYRIVEGDSCAIVIGKPCQ